MGYSRPHSRHLRPLTKLMDWLSLSSPASGLTGRLTGPPTRSSQPRQGNKRKSPVPNQHGAFSKPFRSCLAVFYVEQVALNRHVHRIRSQRTLAKANLKVISAGSYPSSRTFPAGEPRHLPFREGWFGRAGRIVMLPPVVAVYRKDIIEDHCAEPQHDEFPDASDIKCGIETVCFERLPSGAFFIAEGGYGIAQNVAQKSQFEPLVQGVDCDDDLLISLKQQDLTAFWLNVELQS